MENIYFRYRPVVMPGIFLSVMIILAIISGSYFKGRVAYLQVDVGEKTLLNNKLESRLKSLQSAERDVADFSEDAVFALPHRSSAILAVAHLRQQAEKENLTFDQISLRGGSNAQGELVSTNDIYFQVEGEYTSVANYLKSLATMVPIINLKSINIIKSNDTTTAEVTVVTFWSQLPDTLPAITEPIAELSASEKEILNQIESFEKPSNIGINTEAQEPVERTDPFILSGL